MISLAMGMLVLIHCKDASPEKNLIDMLQSQSKSRPALKAGRANKDDASQSTRRSRTVRKSSLGDGPAQRASR